MRKFLLTILVLLTCARLQAQSTNASPYSRFGLGDLNSFSLAQNTGLGGSTVAMVDSFQVNLLNPASYSFAAHHFPIFDFSAVGRFMTLSTSTASTRANAINPNNIALVLPFTRRWGASFGLITYSSMGYRIINTYESEGIGSVTTTFTGAGNTNRVYLGTSYMLVDAKGKLHREQLSLGINGAYLFGDLERKRQIFLPTSSGTYDAEVINSLYARDFMFDAGLIYRHSEDREVRDADGKLRGKKSRQLTFGISATLGRDTKFERSVLARSISQTSLSYIDVIQSIDAERGTIYIPARYNMGLTYDIKGLESSNNHFYKLTFTGQYTLQDWTSYKENFPSGAVNDSLRRASSLHFGVQFIPHQLGFSSSGKVKFFSIINYRVGYYTGNQFLNVGNNSIKNWGLTGGLGIPLINSSSYSMLNLSFEYGARGTQDNGLVLEKYYGFHVGVAFSPSRFDRWFMKRKYD